MYLLRQCMPERERRTSHHTQQTQHSPKRTCAQTIHPYVQAGTRKTTECAADIHTSHHLQCAPQMCTRHTTYNALQIPTLDMTYNAPQICTRHIDIHVAFNHECFVVYELVLGTCITRGGGGNQKYTP